MYAFGQIDREIADLESDLKEGRVSAAEFDNRMQVLLMADRVNSRQRSNLVAF